MENRELSLSESQAADLTKIDIKKSIPKDLSAQGMIDFISANTAPWRELQTYYYCAMMEVETKFKVLNQELSLQYDRNPIETIKTRMKSPESLAEKILRKNLPLSLDSVEENIFDMAGVRVICSFPDDIYMLCDSFLNQDDVFLKEKKDYIKNPKPSGYRGLHLVIEIPIFLHNEKKMMKVEVQLRTIAMDFWASLEHKLRYKKNLSADLSARLGDRLSRCAEMTAGLDKQMQEIRNEIEAERPNSK